MINAQMIYWSSRSQDEGEDVPFEDVPFEDGPFEDGPLAEFIYLVFAGQVSYLRRFEVAVSLVCRALLFPFVW